MGYNLHQDVKDKCFKPFDLLRFPEGSVVLVIHTQWNTCQEKANHQLSYAVRPLGKIFDEAAYKWAWYSHEEFKDVELIGNVFTIIAEESIHNFSSNADVKEQIFPGRSTIWEPIGEKDD